jgi:hypothetical protein
MFHHGDNTSHGLAHLGRGRKEEEGRKRKEGKKGRREER